MISFWSRPAAFAASHQSRLAHVVSQHFLLFIPLDPAHVPPASAQRLAVEILSSAMPADEVAAETDDHITFHDCGENFEDVRCPVCAVTVEQADWHRWMDAAYSSETDGFHFDDITLDCGHSAALNDLHYDFDQGFARFALTATNPRGPVPKALLADLEAALGCKLKQIHRML